MSGFCLFIKRQTDPARKRARRDTGLNDRSSDEESDGHRNGRGRQRGGGVPAAELGDVTADGFVQLPLPPMQQRQRQRPLQQPHHRLPLARVLVTEV